MGFGYNAIPRAAAAIAPADRSTNNTSDPAVAGSLHESRKRVPNGMWGAKKVEDWARKSFARRRPWDSNGPVAEYLAGRRRRGVQRVPQRGDGLRGTVRQPARRPANHLSPQLGA